MTMYVKDLIQKMSNGAANVIIWNYEDGEIYCSTIWYNQIPEKYLEAEIVHVCVRDHELRLGVKL